MSAGKLTEAQRRFLSLWSTKPRSVPFLFRDTCNAFVRRGILQRTSATEYELTPAGRAVLAASARDEETKP